MELLWIAEFTLDMEGYKSIIENKYACFRLNSSILTYVYEELAGS